MRWTRLVAAAATAAALVPAAGNAREAGCAPRVVVQSYVAGQAAVNINGIRCGVEPRGGTADTRIITPGSTSFSVRYLDDLGPAVQTLVAEVTTTFLGETKTTDVMLFRVQQSPIGSFVYDSNKFELSLADQGCIKVTIDDLDEATEFRTINGSCA